MLECLFNKLSDIAAHFLSAEYEEIELILREVVSINIYNIIIKSI